MDHPEQLVTTIDIAPADDVVDDGRWMSLAALHHLQLARGRRVLLLDDRGWTSSGPLDIWSHVSLKEIDETMHMVVGPAEPPPGYSHEQSETDHWVELAATAARASVHVEASTLAALPHHGPLPTGNWPLFTQLGPCLSLAYTVACVICRAGTTFGGGPRTMST